MAAGNAGKDWAQKVVLARSDHGGPRRLELLLSSLLLLSFLGLNHGHLFRHELGLPACLPEHVGSTKAKLRHG